MGTYQTMFFMRVSRVHFSIIQGFTYILSLVLHLASSLEPLRRQHFDAGANDESIDLSEEKQPLSRFHGISILQAFGEKEYGVELPQFHVYSELNDAEISVSRQNTNNRIPSEGTSRGGNNQSILSTLPKSQTANGGVPLFLRTDLDDEETAAKLYAFVLKLLYGQETVTQLHAKLHV